ncbi:MAG: hypothetical protein R3E79_10755 [Caldilineaceae bacterium]
MTTERLTDMDAQAFDQLLDTFIARESKEMGELDASLFYTALEEIYAADTAPITVDVQAHVVDNELHLHLPTPTPTVIAVHDNVIHIHNLRFVIHLVGADEVAA